MTVKLTIDDKEFEVEDGKNVLETCLSLGLNLPYFCWHPAMESVGACRQCGILKYKDEDDDKGKLVMACMEPIKDGLRISLEAEEAKKFRASNIEALMVNHPHDCPVCDEGGECHLQDMTIMTGHTYRRFRFKKRTHVDQYLGPFVHHEMNRCIQCYRCVRFYKDYAGGKDLDVFGAHDHLYFGRKESGVLEDEFSGNLVEVCPTGVFTDKTLRKHFTRKWDLTNAPSICHNCSVGCNIIASGRYGTIRRILTRYNGDVNGYFLCDRGRFGYEYVNSPERILSPLKRIDPGYTEIAKQEILQEIKPLVSQGKKILGIGSPKASLESNFLLRQLVGAENFYAGIPSAQGKLVQRIVEILSNGKVKTPSLDETKDYDAIFILGEDVTNTAPMFALNLRQAAKNKPDEVAKKLKIPLWESGAIKEIDQNSEGPFFITSAHNTKLDEIGSTYRDHPDNIARLGYSVAHNINNQQQDVEIDEDKKEFSQSIAKAMMAAKKPLIVSGTSLNNPSIIESAANVAYALKDQGKDVGLVYIVPEVNSIGLSLISDKFLDEAFQKAKQEGGDTVIMLENDLYRRKNKEEVDAFFDWYKNSIALDYLPNKTTERATFILPSATFAEADGTVINNEGRAQRFYKVHKTHNEVQSSWRWLQNIISQNENESTSSIEDVVKNMMAQFPILEGIQDVAPDRDFRKGTQKIPREPSRYSGRTAMHANIDVNEPQTPQDKDSALSFSMEGYEGIPPAPITPFYRSPGWNSVQAINKYQIEVGGELHGGNPGIRLFKTKEDAASSYFETVPDHFSPKEGKWFVVPLYHIYGSDELSAQSPAVKERIPESYIALNDQDAQNAGITEGTFIQIELNKKPQRVPVFLNKGIPQGVAGLPCGLEMTEGIEFPFWTTFKKANDE